MLIMCQNKKSIVNLKSTSEVFLSSCYGDYRDGDAVKVLASFPGDDDTTLPLGTYENESRAMEILDEIAKLYEGYKRTVAPNPHTTMTFAFEPPKVYRMPEK